MMKSAISIFLAVCITGVMYSCKVEPSKETYYSHKSVQGAYFGSNDIKELSHNEDSVSEHQLNAVLQGKKSFERIIYIQSLRKKVIVYRWEKGSDDVVAYLTLDSVKLVVVHVDSSSSSQVYVIRDPEYRRLVDLLIGDDQFVFNQLNTEDPIGPPLD